MPQVIYFRPAQYRSGVCELADESDTRRRNLQAVVPYVSVSESLRLPRLRRDMQKPR